MSPKVSALYANSLTLSHWGSPHSVFVFFFNILVFDCARSLLLHGLFSGCNKQVSSLVVMLRLLIAVVFLVKCRL